MQTATPLEAAQSKTWDGPAAAVSVVVSTHGRAGLLGGLLDALEAQSHVDFAVVVADNGSHDDTWQVLTQRCRSTRMRLRVLRLDFHDGPGVPRNTCISETTSELIAFTDDDCLPTPGWLSALLSAFDDTTVIVQGRSCPEPAGWAGPWSRSLDVSAPSGLYETANLAARRAAIIDAGGFASERLLSGRAFGEDVVLGSVIARSGGFRFADDAVVHHRVMPGTYDDFVAERRRLAGFPMLVRRVPELRQHLFARVFLSWRTAITDLAIAALGTHILILLLTFSDWANVADIGLLPWIVMLLREAGARPGRNRLVRATQLAAADVTGAVALLTGSLRARRLVI